jgi:hypothetical protein
MSLCMPERHMGSGGTLLLILNPGTTWEWVVSFAPFVLTPGIPPLPFSTIGTGECLAPRAGLDSWAKREVSCILLSISNKMQHYTIFFIMSMLYMFRAVSPPIIRSPKTVNTASGICQACLLLPDAAFTDLSSWWWAEKPLETCGALT